MQCVLVATPNMTDEQWEEAREEARRDNHLTRSKLYRCRDRTCGGLDCASCYGVQSAAQYVAEQEEKEEE